MANFETPLGLYSGGDAWNISVVNGSGYRKGNLAFTPNSLVDLNPVLEIDDESGNIGIKRLPSDNASLFVVGPYTTPNPDITTLILHLEGRGFGNRRGLHINNVREGVVVYADTFSGVGGRFDGNIGAEFSGARGPGGVFTSVTDKAGVFNGDVEITGEIISPNSSISLDSPLDPENKTLTHANIGSAERLNVYSGNVVLDENGEAWVELEEWVEALNADFRYQLTCIGGYSPVYIAEEVSKNRFKIAGGTPQMKISWQLTGIRKDSWAKAHPLVVEEEKPSSEKGCYLHPDLYGQSEEKSKFFAQYPDMMQPVEEKDQLAFQEAN